MRLNTGQNVLRGLLGTVAGFVIGAVLVTAIGKDDTVLWYLLPVVVLWLVSPRPRSLSRPARRPSRSQW